MLLHSQTDAFLSDDFNHQSFARVRSWQPGFHSCHMRNTPVQPSAQGNLVLLTEKRKFKIQFLIELIIN